MRRLVSLDWLRGLLAVSIMVYHLWCWEFAQPDASTLLGRLGIYGVAMFFVLSGLSMAAGYSGYFDGVSSAIRFYIRRIFRIWPLLWVSIVVVVSGERLLNGRHVDWNLVFLNLTTLFGFLSPGSYVNTGAWSIGNEMVYYAITPLVLAICDRNLVRGNLVVLAAMACSLFYGFWQLDPGGSLAGQWLRYVSPGTNLFLYLAGILIYYTTREVRVSIPVGLVLLLVALTVFTLGPGQGDLISVVTGYPRLLFSSAAVVMVLAFFKTPFNVPEWLSRPLTTLGVATYGVYLLHPIVYQALKAINRHGGLRPGRAVMMALTMAFTIFLAVLAYRFMESRFIELGKRLTVRQPLKAG